VGIWFGDEFNPISGKGNGVFYSVLMSIGRGLKRREKRYNNEGELR
jgi:hypothetical protein